MPKDLSPNYPRHPDHLPDGDPVGRPEMVRLTGKTEGSVRKWQERYTLPPCDSAIVWGLPSWRRSTFLAWALRAGHLEDDSRRRAECYGEAVLWAMRLGLLDDRDGRRVDDPEEARRSVEMGRWTRRPEIEAIRSVREWAELDPDRVWPRGWEDEGTPGSVA